MYKKGQLKVGSLVYSVVVLNDKAPIDGKITNSFLNRTIKYEDRESSPDQVNSETLKMLIL